METYKLSASLEGHGDDVRSVVFPSPDTIFSASRDATVQQWKLIKAKPPTFEQTLLSRGTAFINSVAYLPPSNEHPDGLVLSGGKEAIIEARVPGSSFQGNAEALLLGHAANVCTLDVSSDGKHIASGSWDTDARVWQVGKWSSSVVLEGHEASVWAVLFFDDDHVVTGCADQTIRLFHTTGKLIRNIAKTKDVVRALCKLPKGHESGAQIASAGNDALIQFWTIDGKLLRTVQGHESFVYSLACLSNGDIVSSSEDRTLRVWRGNACIQTITHPAISVWCIAVCPANDDIISGASDRVVRVFSKAQERQAGEDDLKAFDDSVKASAIPQQQVGQVNKEKLPGPEFLQQKSGTKEGQVQMIREDNGSVSAHQWSAAAQQWVNVGTVVDAAGSSGRKITYEGADYDYVFDVDIEDGKPPLKLPYNLSQNPYEVARKFIGRYELPVSYLDQVANFIVTNTQGASIGTTPANSQQSQYEIASASNQSSSATRSKSLPQTEYLSITTANLATIFKKIEELDKQLLEQGRKDIALNPSDQSSLSSTVRVLEKNLSSSSISNGTETSTGDAKASVTDSGIDVILRIATRWPPEKRLPGLDLLRILAATSPSLITYTSSDDEITLIHHLSSSSPSTSAFPSAFDLSSPVNNTMLATRTFANLFNTGEGRKLMEASFEQVHALIQPFVTKAPPETAANKNLAVAIATLYINYAVSLQKMKDNNAESASNTGNRPLTLLDDLLRFLSADQVTDPEALYRALIATGSLMTLEKEYNSAAWELMGLADVLKKVKGKGKNQPEKRIDNVIEEIKGLS